MLFVISCALGEGMRGSKSQRGRDPLTQHESGAMIPLIIYVGGYIILVVRPPLFLLRYCTTVID